MFSIISYYSHDLQKISEHKNITSQTSLDPKSQFLDNITFLFPKHYQVYGPIL